SQGSEYGSVFLALPDGTPERLLTTEILYTGLTRAKKLVVIHAARLLLLQAIQNRAERTSRILYT
ncbi:MAG TPA: ATP-binding domain-containing protein, partial [Spirochaetota bacterium]|nr:ATP-binding domain-containing protein [Spirochaetota bacterium]